MKLMFSPVPSYKPIVFMPNAIPMLLRMDMPSFSDLDIVSYLLWRKKYGTYVQKYPIPLAKAAELANEKKGGKVLHVLYRYYCRCLKYLQMKWYEIVHDHFKMCYIHITQEECA